MNVVQGNNLNNDQRRYNQTINSIRHLVERVIGVLKMRFRCILGERQLRYHQTKASKYIYACATLHNYLIFNHYDILRDIDEFNGEQNIGDDQPMNDNINPRNRANRVNGMTRRNEVIAFIR